MRTPLLWLLIAIAPFSAWAEQGDLPRRTSGFHVGFGFGGADAEMATEIGAVSGTDLAFKFFAGYRWWDSFMPWDIDLGIEFGYVDLGERDQGLSDGATWNLSNDGFTADLVGYWPITRQFDLVAKGGLFINQAKLSNETNALPSATEDSTDLKLGIGIAWQSTREFGAVLELETYDTVDGAWLASASAIWQFK